MSIAEALADLSSLLGDGFSCLKRDLEAHGHSETHFPLTPPDGVAWPATTDEVSDILRICNAHGCPVVGWGAGTSLEGHALAVRGGIVVDFSRMDRIIEIRAQDMTCTVQPGLRRMALNTALRDTGLFFSVDPGADASVGGMAMTRASGTTAVRYGTMRDNVLGLTAVLADGRIIRTGSQAPKSSAGYDLTGLLVGSEGTLALVTELTLRLHGQPEATAAAVCAFDDFSGAVAAVTETIQMGLGLARIEFLDPASVEALNAYAGFDMPAVPHLMVEFHGSENGVAEEVESFGEIIAGHGGRGFEWATKVEDRNRLWAARHNAYYAIVQSRPGCKALVTDICVPISRLVEAVEATRADIAASGIPGPILGHVGDGNFHAILLVDPARPDEMKTAHDLSHRMVERALDLAGTSTGEHGVGMGKLDYMAREHGAGWDVMGEIKRALDPNGILNPGKVVRQN